MNYWNPENEQQLIELATAGKSSLEIAKILGGVSRSSVIGKCARMGIKLGGTPGFLHANRVAAVVNRERHAAAREGKPPYKHPPRKPRVPPAPVVAVVPQGLKLEDLGTFQCRWPSGEGPFTFCGHPITHQSYCTFHAKLAFVPKEMRR